MKDVTTATLEQELKKADKLITSAEQDLDSAKQSKAPRSTVKHLEERVKALGSKRKRIEAALSKHTKAINSEEQTQDTKKAAAPSGKKGAKKEGDE